MTVRLGRSLLGSAGLRIANAVLSFAVAMVLARTLGAEGYGLYSLALVVASVCSVFVQFGLPNVVMRETAKAAVSEDWAYMRAVWGWAVRWAALFSLAVLTAGAAVLFFLHDGMEPEHFWTYGLALCLVPLLGLSAIRAGALRGLQHVVLAQIPEMVAKPGVMLVSAITLGLFLPAVVSTAMAMQLVAAGMAFALGTAILWQRRPARLDPIADSGEVSTGALLKVALTMGLASGMNQINNYADILMIGFLWPTEEAGIYRIAYQISLLCAFGLQIVSAVFAPSLARLYRQGNLDRMQILLTRGAIISTVVSMMLALPWIFLGDFLVSWLFGPEFIASLGPALVLMAAQIINASFGPIGMLLYMTGLERYVVRFMMTAAATNVALNLTLIPVYGAFGAALATIVTFALWNSGLWWVARKHLSLNSHVMAFFALAK